MRGSKGTQLKALGLGIDVCAYLTGDVLILRLLELLLSSLNEEEAAISGGRPKDPDI